MITQETYKREKRRLATARNRFTKARSALAEVPNPYSNELNGKGLELIANARAAAIKLVTVASEGLMIFERDGYPDSWANWSSSREEATHYLEMTRNNV